MLQHVRPIFTMALGVLLGLMTALPGYAQHGEVRSEMVDAASGNLIPGALVVIVDDASQVIATAYQTIEGAAVTVPNGDYLARAYALGYTFEEQAVTVQDGDVTLNFSLERAFEAFASLAGTVIDDETGLPVAGAQVNLTATETVEGDSTQHLRRIYETDTDADGGYRFADELIPADYRLTVTAPGFQGFSTSVTLGDGSAATQDVALKEALGPQDLAQLEGQVLATTGTPIAGARVALIYDNPDDPPFVRDDLVTGTVAHETSTDTDGTYQIRAIRPDTVYVLQVRARGHRSQVTYGVRFDAGEIRTADFSLEQVPQTQVSGQITYELSGDPVPDASVIFVSPNTSASSTRTGADGRYSVSVADGTDYVVLARTDGLDSAYVYTQFYKEAVTWTEATRLNVNNGTVTEDATGTPLSEIDFVFPDFNRNVQTTVSGRVTDAGGQPLADALVDVANYNGYWDLQRFTAQTDADGRYTITFDGPYLQRLIARAQKAGYEAQYYDGQPVSYLADPIAVDINDPTVAGVDFQLSLLEGEGAVSVAGRVNGEAGGIDGAFVVATSAESNHQVSTYADDAGAYELRGLRGEAYYIRYTAEGYAPQYADGGRLWSEASPVDVTTRSVLDATLPRIATSPNGATLVGRVRWADGTGASGVLVSVRDVQGGLLGHAFSDASGAYRMEQVQPGAITVYADQVGVEETESAVQVAPGSGAAIDFTLVPSTSVHTEPGAAVPAAFQLEAAYPNPVSQRATIAYTVATSGPLTLSVYDVLGRSVATLVDGFQAAGAHTVSFEVDDLPSGLYLYRMTGHGQSTTRTLFVMK